MVSHMNTTPSAVAGLATETHTPLAKSSRIASQDGRSVRSRPLMRRYEIAHLTPNQEIHDVTRLAPALATFEDCFAALGRGALLQTDLGPTAVEDLLPGDKVLTASGGLQTLLWKGSMTIVPGATPNNPKPAKMTRVAADTFGLGRPSPDLVLGPAARIAHRSNGVRTLTGSDAAFIPVEDFTDNEQFIELTPIAPVHVYQLGFENHERICVNGLEIESLHPGALHTLGLKIEMQQLLMSLFPHKTALSDFRAMLHPRIRLKDLDIFDEV